MNSWIKAAYAEVHQAECRLYQAIEAAYPRGTMASHCKGGNTVDVEILDHSSDRIKVRNVRNGKEYWVGAYFFL